MTTKTTRNILITGGTGFIGGALARRLRSEGFAVRILGRDFSRSADLLAAGAEAVKADLQDRAAIVAACADIDTVFHVGALSAPWARGGSRMFYNINVGGTQNILEGCRVARVRRLIYVSSPSVVFDGRDHRNLPDDAPYPRRFASAYSWTKKLGEDHVNAASRDGLETILIRPKAVFGPGDTSLLPRLIAAGKQGRLPQIGDGRNQVDLTHRDNVVHALRLCLDAPAEALGRTFTITGGESAPLWDVIRQVLRAAGVSDRLRTIPLGIVLAAARLMEARAAITGKEPLLTRYTALILTRTQTYDISAARRYLGYAPVIGREEGIAQTIAALQTGDTSVGSEAAYVGA